MAISFEIPNILQASGISSRTPPPRRMRHRHTEKPLRSTERCGQIDRNTQRINRSQRQHVMVIAAPAILMVAPSGIETDRYRDPDSAFHTAPYSPECSRRAAGEEGIHAAFAQAQQHQGNGLRRIFHHTSNGLTTSATVTYSQPARPAVARSPTVWRTGGCQGRRNQTKNTDRCEANTSFTIKVTAFDISLTRFLVVRYRDAVRNRGQLPTPGSRCITFQQRVDGVGNHAHYQPAHTSTMPDGGEISPALLDRCRVKGRRS